MMTNYEDIPTKEELREKASKILEVEDEEVISLSQVRHHTSQTLQKKIDQVKREKSDEDEIRKIVNHLTQYVAVFERDLINDVLERGEDDD